MARVLQQLLLLLLHAVCVECLLLVVACAHTRVRAPHSQNQPRGMSPGIDFDSVARVRERWPAMRACSSSCMLCVL